MRNIILIGSVFLLLMVPALASVNAKETVVDQSFRIEPDEYKLWEFESGGSLRLYIDCVSERFTFSLYLISDSEFDDFKEGRNFDFVYQASTIFEADLVWDIPEGKHYLIAVNDFSDVAVHLELEIQTDDILDDACCGGVMVGMIGVVIAVCISIIVVKRARRKD
jgi:hypothetical protein